MADSLSIAVICAKCRRANALRPARAEQRKVGHDTQTDPSVSLPMTTQHSSA
jgi:hypothetical protein